MSANRFRGEIEAVLDGVPRRLCLTLGALAELESSLGAGDLAALLARFAEGRFSAADLARLVGAGLRGAGMDVTDDEVSRMRAEGGAAGFVRIAGALLQATFAENDPDP